MRMTALVCPPLFGLVLGCATTQSTAPTPADDANCPQMVQSFDALCADPTVRQAPPEASKAMKQTLEQQRGFITTHCRSVAVPERVAKMDACIADIGGVAQTTASEAAARRSAASPKVAEVRADPEYRAAVAKLRTLLDEQRLHCENADNAEKDNSPNRELWRQKCRQAEDRAAAANGERHTILRHHGIDPRDADALGLKP